MKHENNSVDSSNRVGGNKDVFIKYQSLGNIAKNDFPKIPKVDNIQENKLSQELGTPVNNALGIPDAWIAMIANNIPESNVNARKAALLMLYYDVKTMTANNQDDLFKNDYKWSAAFTCTASYLPNRTENKFFAAYIDKFPSKKMEILSRKVDNNMGGHIIHKDFGPTTVDTEESACKYFINH